MSLKSNPVHKVVAGGVITALGLLTFSDGASEPIYDVTFASSTPASAAGVTKFPDTSLLHASRLGAA
jgi:hypothetical protein